MNRLQDVVALLRKVKGEKNNSLDLHGFISLDEAGCSTSLQADVISSPHFLGLS